MPATGAKGKDTYLRLSYVQLGIDLLSYLSVVHAKIHPSVTSKGWVQRS